MVDMAYVRRGPVICQGCEPQAALTAEPIDIPFKNFPARIRGSKIIKSNESEDNCQLGTVFTDHFLIFNYQTQPCQLNPFIPFFLFFSPILVSSGIICATSNCRLFGHSIHCIAILPQFLLNVFSSIAFRVKPGSGY